MDIPTTVKNKALVEKRREQIVLAAIKLFSLTGFHKTTLRDLSEETGISYGNIYDYVGSKHDIFYLIHEYLSDRVFEALEQAVENVDDPVEKLRRMVRAEFNLLDAWSDGILLLYQEGHVLEPPFLQKFLRKEHDHVQMFAQVINEGVQKGLFRECNPRLAANLIKTIVDGWVLKRWDLRGYATRQEAEKLILEMVLVGLLPERVQSQRTPSNLTNSLSGKKALVIGAQTVLGSAICSALSAQGARVCGYVNDLSPMGNKHNGHLNAFIGQEIPVYSESRHGVMNGTLFDRIQDAFGPIDVYVHDLGIGSLEAPLPDAWETDPVLARSMDANLSCAQELAHCLTKRMPNKPWGRVIYLAPWAWDQYIDKIRFDTVSAGTMALTRSLAEALAPSHISVNCVVPGFIKTLRPSRLQKAKTDEAKAKVPSSRLGDISDVTNVVLFLSGDDSRYLTNQVLRVAGGY